MTTLADLKGFDLDGAEVTVWVFKRPRSNGQRRYVGRWIGVTDDLTVRLRETVASHLNGITETIEYDVLAQNNEASALTIEADETDTHLIAAGIGDPTPDLKVRNLADLVDSEFYVARFAHADGVVLAIRRTDPSWSTRRASGVITMMFTDDELDLEEKPVFTLQPDFDFYVFHDRIFIRSKPRFESLLSYKAGHEKIFQQLTSEPDFAAIFADVGPLTAFVGSNKIHLRRAVAIQQKGHYKDAEFMDRLRIEHGNMNLNITFDTAGKIIATVESGRDIFLALLDHRLDSRLTQRMYDVPSSEPVD